MHLYDCMVGRSHTMHVQQRFYRSVRYCLVGPDQFWQPKLVARTKFRRLKTNVAIYPKTTKRCLATRTPHVIVHSRHAQH